MKDTTIVEIAPANESRVARRSLWIAASVTAVALVAIGAGLHALVEWLRPPPIEAPPPELRSEPGLQRFLPHGQRSLLSRRSPRSDEEEPPAVPLDHPFAKTRITGRVYDLITGTGIAGATVRIRPTFGQPKLGPASGDGSAAFVTRSDGSYAMKGIPPGNFDLEISATGYAPTKSSFKKFTALEDDDGFDVGLAHGGALEGRVLTADHRPVVGARVTASAGPTVSLYEQATLVTTGDDGRFVIDPVESRELRVFATHPAHGSRLLVVPATEDPSRDVELVLDGGRAIVGRVRDSDGPIAGAQVMVGLQRLEERIVAASPNAKGVSVSTDHDGAFEIHAPESGPLVLLAQAAGYELASTVVPETNPSPVDLMLERAVEFGGVVIAANGEPAVKAQVTVMSMGKRNHRLPLEGWTGEDGRFRISGVPRTGPYRVAIHHFAHPPLVTTEREVGPEHRYQLEPEGRILGSILDARSGRPVVRYEYAVSGPTHREAGAESVSGSFEVDQLPAGTYVLTVEADGYEPATVDHILVGAGETVNNVVVRLRPAGSIAGRVRGAGHASVVVHAREQNSHIEAEAPVGEDGAFSFPDLPSGNYTLTAFGESDEGELRGEVENVAVESGRATEGIDIVLTPVTGAPSPSG